MKLIINNQSNDAVQRYNEMSHKILNLTRLPESAIERNKEWVKTLKKDTNNFSTGNLFVVFGVDHLREWEQGHSFLRMLADEILRETKNITIERFVFDVEWKWQRVLQKREE